MNYTENYRLNQWDPEDRILREDFNRDNVNVENGLMALQQALKTETQSREAAINAAKQEASQTVTAAAGALESSKADKTALAQLQAMVDAMPFVKLREVTVGTAVNQVDVDVRDIRWQDYVYVMLVPKLLVSQEINIAVRINGMSDLAYKSQNSERYCLYEFEGHAASDQRGTAVQIRLAEQNGCISTVLNLSDDRGYGTVVGGSPLPQYVTASGVKTINFFAYDDVLIQPGGKIFIYGVKL